MLVFFCLNQEELICTTHFICCKDSQSSVWDVIKIQLVPAGSLAALRLDPLIHTRSTNGFSDSVSNFSKSDENFAVNLCHNCISISTQSNLK